MDEQDNLQEKQKNLWKIIKDDEMRMIAKKEVSVKWQTIGVEIDDQIYMV